MSSSVPPTNPSSSSGKSSGSKGGPEPDSDKFKQAMKKVEKVEKVGEVDLDQQRRRPTYKTNEDEETEDATKGKLPTPFDPSFHMTSVKPSAPDGFLDLESKSISTPPSSASPQVHSSAASGKEDLPSGQNFWEGFDLPDEAPKKVQFAETPQLLRTSHDFDKESQEGIEKISKKKISPLDALSASQSKDKHSSKHAQEIEEAVKHKKEQAIAASWKEKKKKQEEISASSQMPDSLPPATVQMADAAQAFVASYLSPHTAALFHHMVGTLSFWGSQTPGVSRTEIILNSSAFEKSPFYNSSITLEKFATAPDSFNITLSGSAQAVSLFNANIANLSTAFSKAYEKNKIGFRIGRLEASYAANPPATRRKEKTEDNKSDA